MRHVLPLSAIVLAVIMGARVAERKPIRLASRLISIGLKVEFPGSGMS
jgi:hypothetical protein